MALLVIAVIFALEIGGLHSYMLASCNNKFKISYDYYLLLPISYEQT